MAGVFSGKADQWEENLVKDFGIGPGTLIGNHGAGSFVHGLHEDFEGNQVGKSGSQSGVIPLQKFIHVIIKQGAVQVKEDGFNALNVHQGTPVIKRMPYCTASFSDRAIAPSHIYDELLKKG
jgi:isopentenyl phosphate kinase